MAITHRQARQKLGSRTRRRANTNRKGIPGRPLGNSGRIIFKYRFPRPASRKVAVRVAQLVKDSRLKEESHETVTR